MGALNRAIAMLLLLIGCVTEVSVERDDDGSSAAGMGGGPEGGADPGRLPEDLERYCWARLTAWRLRLACEPLDEAFVRRCVADLEYADRVGCVEETLARYECAAVGASLCRSIKTGCNYEAAVWRRACYPMDDEAGSGAP